MTKYKKFADQQRFFRNLKIRLGIEKEADWLRVETKDIIANGGWNFLQSYYKGSVSLALCTIYPSLLHDIWKWPVIQRRHWQKLTHRRSYLDWFLRESNLKYKHELYSITTRDIANKNGESLLKMYKGSNSKLIIELYPEQTFFKFKFVQVPAQFWYNEYEVSQYIKWLQKELDITTEEQWKSVRRDDFWQNYGNTLTKTYTIASILEKYPVYAKSKNTEISEEKKDHIHISSERNISKSQKHLYKLLRKILPTEKIFMEYSRTDLVYKNSKKKFILDIFIPSLNLAFEYQGEQHYHFNWRGGEPSLQSSKDKEKIETCLNIGISVVEIPYWNNNEFFLKQLLLQKRPDLILN